MRIINALLGTSAFLIFLLPQTLAAPPGAHLNIEEVAVSIDDLYTTLEISGSDFDFGSPLSVTLAGVPVLTVNLTSSTTITVTVLTASYSAGDYLLAVSTGKGQSKNDEYDLTIGAVGPRGEIGPAGADGQDGAQGPAGADGKMAHKARLAPKEPKVRRDHRDRACHWRECGVPRTSSWLGLIPNPD